MLAPLNQEHKQVLDFCERVRIGLYNNIESSRIRKYIEWFKESYLEPHFKLEQDLVFPLLGKNLRVKRALANHRRITKLLTCSCADIKVLNLLEEELATYIRFEERVLYKELKTVASAKDFSEIEKAHASLHLSHKEWNDKFWELE